jgi:hypothetical protein
MHFENLNVQYESIIIIIIITNISYFIAIYLVYKEYGSH